jgi:hypothetical protein
LNGASGLLSHENFAQIDLPEGHGIYHYEATLITQVNKLQKYFCRSWLTFNITRPAIAIAAKKG